MVSRGVSERATDVWDGEGGAANAFLRAMLLPAAVLYGAVTRLRNATFDLGLRTEARAPIPVVSVGNLTVGGTGKTPLTAWMARRLAEAGRTPAIVLRGYGDDETLLHRELNPDVPVFVCAKRIEGARAAATANRDVAVLDDGFQHRMIARDLDVVLVSAEQWTDTPMLLPRGRWRERPAALDRADVVVITRKTATDEAVTRCMEGVRSHTGASTCVARLVPGPLRRLSGEGERPVESLSGMLVLAVAALADPRPFFQQLRGEGAVVETIPYRDHHDFTEEEAEALLRHARGREVVITRKDAVKLRRFVPASASFWVMDQEVRFESGESDLVGQITRLGSTA